MSSLLEPDEKESSQPYSSYKKHKGIPILVPLVGVIVVILLTAVGVIYVIRTKPEVLGLAKSSQAEDKKDLETTISQVGKLMLLPTETPTLATISDLEKVKGQDFFKNAAAGDKVLVYTGAKKAILYRPSNNKIIEVGVVNIPTAAPSNSAQVSGAEDTFIPTATPLPTQALIPTAIPTVFTPTEAPIQ
jgi:hypothetical protein